MRDADVISAPKLGWDRCAVARLALPKLNSCRVLREPPTAGADSSRWLLFLMSVKLPSFSSFFSSPSEIVGRSDVWARAAVAEIASGVTVGDLFDLLCVSRVSRWSNKPKKNIVAETLWVTRNPRKPRGSIIPSEKNQKSLCQYVGIEWTKTSFCSWGENVKKTFECII